MAMDKRPGFMAGRKGERGSKFDDQRARQATMAAIKELFQEKDNSKRAEIEERLTSKLTPDVSSSLEEFGQESATIR